MTVLLVAVAGLAQGRTIYVDADANGLNDGTSWADAYTYLQDALADANYAAKPVEIRVADGIYTPDSNSADPNGTGDRTATFQLVNGVTLQGGYAGFGEPNPNTRDIDLYETILSGDLDGNDVDVNDPCDLSTEPSRAENSYHVVTSSGTNMTAALDGFTVTAGNANGPWQDRQNRGGGMYNDDSNPTVSECTFNGNSAGEGGGMYNDAGSPTIANCAFNGNVAVGRRGGGGGMYNLSRSLLTNCMFVGNAAVGQWGGGGGMYNLAGRQTLVNCTFSGNSAVFGAGILNDESSLTLTNCILWDDGLFNANGLTLTITYSDLQGIWPGEGNIDADPCFVETGYWDPNGTPEDANDDFWVDGDYHLLPDSPCIDAGDPNYIAEPNETDLDGRPRIIGGRIDMGAYEYSPPVPAGARIVPRTINLTIKRKWITCYVWLGEDYNVADIDPNSVLLEHEIEPERLWVDEEEQVAVAKFSRSEVKDILNVGDVELTITGQLTDGTAFEGTDVIRVIDKGSRKPAT